MYNDFEDRIRQRVREGSFFASLAQTIEQVRPSSKEEAEELGNVRAVLLQMDKEYKTNREKDK